jgi:hypothetical protein
MEFAPGPEVLSKATVIGRYFHDGPDCIIRTTSTAKVIVTADFVRDASLPCPALGFTLEG